VVLQRDSRYCNFTRIREEPHRSSHTSQIPLPAEDSSSVASEVGSEALRLKELELEARRAELEPNGKNHTVQAPLVNRTVCLRDAERDDVCEIPIVCAVTDLRAAEYDVILPADVVRELQATSVAVNVSSCDVIAVCDVGTEANDPEVEHSAPEDVDSLPMSEVEADATALVLEQEQDPSLANCWIQAQDGKGGFLTHKGLLYHKDQVEGQTVCQLCEPQDRRSKILQLAHESVFGGHLGERKTRERISLSFYWPGLRKTVLSHVQSCCKLSVTFASSDY